MNNQGTTSSTAGESRQREPSLQQERWLKSTASGTTFMNLRQGKMRSLKTAGRQQPVLPLEQKKLANLAQNDSLNDS